MTARAGHLTFIGAAALALASSIAVSAQQSPAVPATVRPPLVIQVGLDLIRIDASVTDRHGRPVMDLRAEDFTLEVDGEKRAITNAVAFEQGPGPIGHEGTASGVATVPPQGTRPVTLQVPSTVVFLVDDLNMSAGSMATAKEALAGFAEDWPLLELRAALRATSHTSMAFSLYVDPERFAGAVQSLKYNVNSAKGGLSTKNVQSNANKTSHSMQDWDPQESERFERRVVSLTSTINTLRGVPGRKALVFISEGLSLGVRGQDLVNVDAPLLTFFSDSDGEGALRAVTEVANRASVVLYTVDPRGLAIHEAGAQDGANISQASGLAATRRLAHLENQRTLQQIAEDTGGLATVNTNDIQAGLVGALRDVAAFYLIGFQPPEKAFSKAEGRRKFHRIKLTVKRPDLKVRTRTGFYGVTDQDMNDRSPPD